MNEDKIIAYQGEPGANSHSACQEAYRGHQPLPCPTFEDAFAAVRTGRAALAMIPIDNSLAGRVASPVALPQGGQVSHMLWKSCTLQDRLR